jgi:hypothetical protein
MTRVEWTRLEGNDVEAVVAMFINREHPRSTRITPSKGDGGIDILDRDVDGSGLDVVYQVKRYTGPLTTGQKNEIEGSLKRLKGPQSDKDEIKKDPRWKDLNVQEWHLVTPWDPSPEAELWLQALGQTYGVNPIWDGLVTVEQLAAKYDDVVDYYLHGGREKITEIYNQVAALFAVGQPGEGRDVPSVSARVQKALSTLDHDPHYRYEHRFGEGAIPPLGDRPGLVFSWMAADEKSGRWTVVDVIARCAASPQERPITVEGHLRLEPGSAAEKAYRDFLTYGAPFTSPAGAYYGEMDAPGGLGGPLEGATMSVGSVLDIGDNPQLYLEVLDSDGKVLGGVNLNRVDRSQGTGGVRVVLEEEHQVFSLKDRYKIDEGTGTRTLRFGDIVGKPVTAVAKAMTFISHCHPPNTGRLSIRHTPPEKGFADPNLGVLSDEEARAHVERIVKLVGMLVAFQERSSAVITVPDLDQLPAEQVRNWQFADALLRGHEAVGTYPEGNAVFAEFGPGVEVEGGHVVTAMPFTTTVGTQTIELGQMYVELEDAILVERREMQGRTFHVFQTPDRRVKHRFAPDDE